MSNGEIIGRALIRGLRTEAETARKADRAGVVVLADWSHLFPCCDDGVMFKNSVPGVEGIVDFKAMCGCLGPTGGSSTRETALIHGEISTTASPGGAASAGGSSIDFSDSSVVVITGATSGVGYQAAHALDRVPGKAVWDPSERPVGIGDPSGPNAGSAS